MKKYASLFPVIILLISMLWISGCRRNKPAPIVALSKSSPRYVNWLKRCDSTILTVNLYGYSIDSAIQKLDSCSGLLLTGGEDLFPGLYGNPEDSIHCEEMDHYRDTLEVNLILRAMELGLPVFGICRGEQLMNVVLDGSLILDVPVDYDTLVIHRCEDYTRCFHWVYLEPGSQLYAITRCDSALVTTNHHQAIAVPASGLLINARSGDDLPEGIEWQEPKDKPFMMGVQWHPERMEAGNPLSGPLAAEFLRQCRQFDVRK